jgi:helix-hairpin-helix protein
MAAALLSTTLVVVGCGDDDDSTSADVASEAPAEKISANTADQEELQTIPGVGENIAHEIMEYRPYDAETGPAKFREEMSKYLSDDDVESVMAYLSFD